MNNIDKKFQTNNERFMLYIYPSDPEQIIFYGGKYNMQSECKIQIFDSLFSMMQDKLPISPECMELVNASKEKNYSNKNTNVFNYLVICNADDYATLDLPTIHPPLSVVKKFKVHILDIVNKYLKEYGKILSSVNPAYYGKLKESRDSLQESYFSSAVNKINKKNKPSKDNLSKIYVFPMDIENALNKKANTKVILLNSSIIDIKKNLPINIDFLYGIEDNQYIILSDDFYMLKYIPTITAPSNIAVEYRRFVASAFAQKYFVEENKSMKPKKARALFNILSDRITEDAYNLYMNSKQNQK